MFDPEALWLKVAGGVVVVVCLAFLGWGQWTGNEEIVKIKADQKAIRGQLFEAPKADKPVLKPEIMPAPKAETAPAPKMEQTSSNKAGYTFTSGR